MMRALHALAICSIAVLGTPAGAQDIDWKKVDEAVGRTAAVSGDVHRYGFPRTDLQVTLSEVRPDGNETGCGALRTFAPRSDARSLRTDAGVGAEPDAMTTRTMLFLSRNVTLRPEPACAQPSGYLTE